jgi:uncharacterized metal-binding protein YceD (DUF177 family)
MDEQMVYRIATLAELEKVEDIRGNITADAAELRALADRLLILEVVSYNAEYQLTRDKRPDLYRLFGSFRADVVQECVVSLKPVKQKIQQRFDILCGDAALLAGLEAEEKLNDADDLADITPEGTIEIGELIIQHLGLALDPYPRAKDADFNEILREAGLLQQDNQLAEQLAALQKKPQ